jgi:hypothetical protein
MTTPGNTTETPATPQAPSSVEAVAAVRQNRLRQADPASLAAAEAVADEIFATANAEGDPTDVA